MNPEPTNSGVFRPRSIIIWFKRSIRQSEGIQPVSWVIPNSPVPILIPRVEPQRIIAQPPAGPTAAILYTLVRNAANHNLDIHPYLRDVIEKVPALMAEGKPLDELLPDQWALANPDKVLLNRDHENH